MSETLTHYRKLQHPDFIGAYALEPGKDLTLTIASVKNESFKSMDGKQEEGIIIRWAEPDYKPMICNATNGKAITKALKTPYIEQWVGQRIQLYSKRIRAFGEDMDALRVREYAPKTEQIDPTSPITKINACQTLDELKSVYGSLTKSEQAHPDVVKAKDVRKGEVSK